MSQTATLASLFGMQGKRILVLGGGQGMGEATVRLLTSLGAAVAVVDLEQDRAARVVKEVTRSGATALPFSFDALDDAALVAGIARIEREFGPLDGMASVIGMAAWSPLIDMDMQTWDLDHSRNLRYFFLAAREVARNLLKRAAPGSIACVSSVDGIRSAPLHGAYGAAKAGLINLARTMAEEWSPHRIRINVVSAGAIVTPRVPHTGEDGEARMMARVPMRRRGSVDEIAKALIFFLSDLSSYVTGQTLAVDGGYTAATLFDLALKANPAPGAPTSKRP
jgi:NAD(P)-dependent dehydrogenase (short-subunit alcohol dehydrogenase family)